MVSQCRLVLIFNDRLLICLMSSRKLRKFNASKLSEQGISLIQVCTFTHLDHTVTLTWKSAARLNQRMLWRRSSLFAKYWKASLKKKNNNNKWEDNLLNLFYGKHNENIWFYISAIIQIIKLDELFVVNRLAVNYTKFMYVQHTSHSVFVMFVLVFGKLKKTD